MENSIRYVHTNLIAEDWKKLAHFYMEVFRCEPVYPERNLSGDWLDRMTRFEGSHLKGIHLRLPGYDQDGPTLEIFSYNKTSDATATRPINKPGFAHIAFHVSDFNGVLEKVIEHGGSMLGEVIETKIEGVGLLKAVYAKDPENNIVELQHWT